MYLMYADEADQDGSREYLIYGAVFIPAEASVALHDELVSIRDVHGFEATDLFKFSTGTKPPDMPREAHTAAKSAVLEAAHSYQCVTCCYVIPHAIAKGQTHENRLKFGVNTLLSKFDEFLTSVGSQGGIAFLDSTTDYRRMITFVKYSLKDWNSPLAEQI
jgi:hypothetical protein